MSEIVKCDKNNIFKKKLTALWKDDIKYTKRLLVAASASLAFCFTFLFFGPVEITAFSSDSLSFDVMEITPVMAAVTAAVFVLLSFLLSVFKGRIFRYAVSGVFTATICGYIQGNFLNGKLGALTGDAIDWQNQTDKMLAGLAVLFVIALIPYIIQYFNKKAWLSTVSVISALLVVMQSVALITIYTGDSAVKIKDYDYYLSTDEIVDYSAEQNTLVFLMDRLDYDFIEEVLENDPEFFQQLDGFTSYTNAISEHARTKPAANFIMTACEEDVYQIPQYDFFEKSWDSGGKNILKDLKSAGYKIDIYSDINCMFGHGNTAKEYVSNASSLNNKIDASNIIDSLLTLSAYRYVPLALKPFFWCYTDDINNGAYLNSTVYEIDETKFNRDLEEIKLNNKNKYFKFYHFNGSHTPYTLNADGTRSSGSTSSLEQTKGSFQILFNAFKKMKENGIYKNAGIIITADHGSPISDKEPLQKANRIGLFYKPPGSEGTPLQTSEAPVSLKNVPATILKSAGIDHSKYGRALDEISENEEIVRTFYKAVMVDGREEDLYIYEIRGHAADFKNWVNTKVLPIKYPFYG